MVLIWCLFLLSGKTCHPLPSSRSTRQKRTNLLADKGLIIKNPLEYVQHDAEECIILMVSFLPKRFLENSPIDHYSVWNPSFARRLLAKHGFKTYKIRITGHHPERIIPHIGSDSPFFRIVGLLSRLFRLGDTFEVYATKERDDA